WRRYFSRREIGASLNEPALGFENSKEWSNAVNRAEHMSIIGKVASLGRYPVKSVRGEELDEAFAGYPGVYGDRVFAFKSSASPAGFPYFTAREQRRLLQYRPLFRYPDKAARPVNLIEADKMGAGPLSAD